VKKGATTSHVRVDIGGNIVTSSITNEAVDDLGIKMLWAGGRRGGCGTLGALSNETNGAPHVAIF
jgi:hypothetical protein